MILTTQEREKFLAYCMRQADSCRQMAEQLEKVGTHIAMDSLAKTEKSKAKAYAIVALDLRSMQEDSISPEEQGNMEDIQ